MHERITTDGNDIVSFDNYVELNNIYPPDLYKKLASTLLLKSVGLPTLPGFVVSRLDERTINFLSVWATGMGSTRLSLRFDSPRVEDHIRLSSLNPTIEDLKKVSSIILPPVIGLVLAENDRYKQGHSVLTQFLDDRIWCDIIGPGFDAGDLTRGNVTPHETFVIDTKNPEDFSGELCPLDIIDHKVTTHNNYLKSRNLRHGVIYSTILKGLGKSVLPQALDPEKQKKVDDFLSDRDATIPEEYQTIGWEKLSKIFSYVSPLHTFHKHYKENYGIDVRGKVLSASFLHKHGLVFWDFFDGGKYSSKK